MRRLAVALALLALAGCTSNPDPAVAEVADEPQSGQVVLEGQFMKTHVEDQEVSSEGGLHTLEVEGWRNVLLQFDIGINADLFLVPPGCDGPAAPCALQFTSDDTAAGTRVLVPANGCRHVGRRARPGGRRGAGGQRVRDHVRLHRGLKTPAD